MGLPFKPEPLAAMRARYPEAVKDVMDYESYVLGTIQRPGQSRRHVFDHEDGLRLIFSRDSSDKGLVFLHASASIESGSRLFHEARGISRRSGGSLNHVMDWLDGLARPRIEELSGQAMELWFWHHFIPHFWKPETEAPAIVLVRPI